ncbi:Na+/H+ antiporter subunit E [Nocardioides sp.]|uniref:Na+/H+ antiporter subunit E n=1 Tax=Nocardioides sp. TaxID=35761 RepID=UPI0027358EA2|nr:Na+/H+ antiporter subunit E [Nocardioides sp.]MDP3892784.1 Na+/H+ antiporter subunit E [Nocardioides sp.]
MTLLRLALGYAPWLIWQLTVSALHLAANVCTPGSTYHPRIVKLPMPDFSDFEVLLLTSSITITPGTLVLGISPAADGPRAAFVQALFGDDEELVHADLARMSAKVLSATRGSGADTSRPTGSED